MNEIELQIVHIQARLFENASYLPGKEFATSFMKSDIARNLDKKYNSLQYCGEEYLLEAFMEDVGIHTDGTRYPSEVMFWMGYIYRYWHYLTGESSREIVRQAPPELVKQTYAGLHTIDPSLAVERLKELGSRH